MGEGALWGGGAACLKRESWRAAHARASHTHQSSVHVALVEYAHATANPIVWVKDDAVTSTSPSAADPSLTLVRGYIRANQEPVVGGEVEVVAGCVNGDLALSSPAA